jgi:hypothetical protein
MRVFEQLFIYGPARTVVEARTGLQREENGAAIPTMPMSVFVIAGS